MGPGGECVVPAMASRDGVTTLVGHTSSSWNAPGVELRPGNYDVRVHDPGHVPHEIWCHQLGAFVRTVFDRARVVVVPHGRACWLVWSLRCQGAPCGFFAPLGFSSES